MRNNFASFIASYGKPDNIPTYNCLKKLNAKYPIYIVIGVDDPKYDEYIRNWPNNLVIFDKRDYIDEVDEIGLYSKTHKVCTYSRLAIDDFADELDYRYVGYLFDDINSMNLRYVNGDKVSSIGQYNIDDIIDIYISLLNSSEDIYIVGPPQSSFYIGVNTEAADKYTARFGNMLIYDRQKELVPNRASTIEDMSIVIYNNYIGQMSICPFGLQVNCRDPHITDDSYCGMQKSEYYQQWSLVFNGATINVEKPQLPYKNFIPKIISPNYRKEK